MDNNQTQEQNLTKKERKALRRQEKLIYLEKKGKTRLAKRIGLWAAIIIGVGGIVFAMVKFGGQSVAVQPASLVGAVNGFDHTEGSLQPAVKWW